MSTLPIAVVRPEDSLLYGISERRLLAMNRMIAYKLRGIDGPRYVEAAQNHLDQVVAAGNGSPWSDRWRELLTRGPLPCAEQLEDASDDGHDMRQATPIVGVLTEEERRAVLAEVYGHAMV